MKNRISVKAIIIKNDKVMLVKHVDRNKGSTWWAFPGGGLEEDETIFACAEREVWEETGLKVKADKLKYVRQLLYPQIKSNIIELFVTTSSIKGTETIANCKGKGSDDKLIKECKFMSKEEIKDILVLPKSLKEKIFNVKLQNNSNIEFIGIDKAKY